MDSQRPSFFILIRVSESVLFGIARRLGEAVKKGNKELAGTEHLTLGLLETSFPFIDIQAVKSGASCKGTQDDQLVSGSGAGSPLTARRNGVRRCEEQIQT